VPEGVCLRGWYRQQQAVGLDIDRAPSEVLAGKSKRVAWVIVPFGPGEVANPKDPCESKAKGCVQVGLHEVGAPAGETLQDLEEDITGNWKAFPGTSLSVKAPSALNYALET
jgi:hypothetical protein